MSKKTFNFLTLVVTLSMIVTTVSAQTNLSAVRKPAPVAIADVDVSVSDDVVTLPDAPEAEPPEPELVLTDPYVSKPVLPADTTGLPRAPTVDVYTGRPRETLGRATDPGPVIGVYSSHDPVVQRALGPNVMPPTIQNFEGIPNVDGVYPPDTDGQVGPNHYVQMVNVSTAVYDKSGNLLYGPFHPSDLWPSGDVCNVTNDGDVVVLYDQMADRWLLTQFGLPYPVGPYYQCIAVSKGPNPTDDPNDWYPYTFLVHEDKMNDYPKLGVWPDGYYMSANQFPDNPEDRSTSGAWVFERDKMLNGEAATFQYFDLEELHPTRDYFRLLPSNLMGDTLPPEGAPNYFASVDRDWYDTDDVFHIFAFHTDWDNPSNSSLSLVNDLFIADYDPLCQGERSCVPQPDTAQGLDALSPRLMMHLWYRNFGDYETLVVNHTVDVGGERAGVRWYEVRNPGADAYVHQQGTFAPDDGQHRWMGSIAMDGAGNMALGYSIASETMYPSIRYTGRLAGDPLGTLPQGEATIINGSGSQTGSAARWGDYSAMSVDPMDDCTFWYTQEYVETTGAVSWQTRIASFRFPECLAATGRLEGTVTSTEVGNPPVAGAKVMAEANPTYVVYSKQDGSYGFPTIPTGTFTVTAAAYGFQAASVPGVVVSENMTTTQDLQLTPLTMYIVNGTVTDDTTGWPLYARIDIEGYPGSPIWNDPVTGYYSVTLSSGAAHTMTVSAWVNGYVPETRALGFPVADATEDFVLVADLGTCTAPGYKPTAVAYSEDFEASDGGYTHAGTQDEWEWGTPSVWPMGCASGSNCWGTDLDGNYNDNADYVLTSTVISLAAYPPGTILTAKWWQAWSMEMGYDYASAQVSINDGPWTDMWRSSTYGDWTSMGYDISAAAGGNVQFRWGLTSDSGVNEPGYYVDDVQVTVGCGATSGGLVVGNVYSATMPTVGLVGATVRSDLDESALAAETPLDPDVADGFYTIFSPAGSHTFTATLRGYGGDSATPTVVLSDTIRQDFYLDAPMTYVVSGTVTDATTGWPLYASIAVDGRTYWNDPVTSYYSATVPEAFPYNFEVVAWVDGYESETRVVGPLTVDATEDFALAADLVNCTAPGYVYSALLREGFESDTFPPTGWASYDLDGAEQSWISATFGYASDMSALHDYGPEGWMEDGWLVTPVVTPTASSELSVWEYVEWADYYYKHSLWACTSGCDSPPTNYTEIAEFAAPTGDTWEQRAVDLSAYDGTPVQLAFRYEGDWADTWWIDDVTVSPTFCDPAPGGLVVGNVYDENTLDPLDGADVTNEYGYAATTEATPDDPAVEDGFYTIFSPAGTRTFTGTMASYGPDVAAITVVQSDTVGLEDFYLPAGWLDYTPPSLSTVITMGMTTTLPFTLTNNGGMEAAFELVEVPGGFAPVAADPSGINAVLWDQPWDGTGSIHASQCFPDFGNSCIVSADDFTNAAPWTIDSISFEGAFWNAPGVPPTLADADSLHWYIYPDAGGEPSGYPGDGLGTEIWSYTALPTDPEVTIGGPVGGDVTLDLSASLITLPPGNYWIVFHPMLSFTLWGQYGYHAASTTNLQIANLIDPDDLTGQGWTSWTPWTSDYDAALRLEGTAGEVVDPVPWLSEDPISGTLAASGGEHVVGVTFDAGVPEVNQPGEYYARLDIQNDTPYDLPYTSVTMTVMPSPTWGRLVGTVNSLGYCDVNMATLANADVLVEGSDGVTWTTTTDGDGYYELWVDGTYAPVDVTITADEHETGYVTGVAITGQVTTTLDVDLHWDKPCVSVDPTSLSDALAVGHAATHALTIENDGFGSLAWEVVETTGGGGGAFDPLAFHVPRLALSGDAPNKPPKPPKNEVTPVAGPAGAPRALGDLLFEIEVDPITTDNQNLGVEFALGYWWVTGSNADGDPNKLYKIDMNGVLTATYDQPASVNGWGWRDLAFDGTYLYASGSALVDQIDPATGAVTGFTIPSPIGNPARALAYDPATDHFWTASWGSDIVEFDRAGTTVHTYTNELTGKYGMAWDTWSPGSPYLWVWNQNSDNDASEAVQYRFDGIDLTATGLSFRSADGAGIAGGATIIPNIVPGKLVFAGMQQASPDVIAGYEVFPCLPVDISWAAVDPASGTVAAYSSATTDVILDASALTTGVYTGDLCLVSDDPVNGLVRVPMTLTVEPCVEISGAGFDYVPTAPNRGDLVTFTGSAEAGTAELPVTWTWNFGDGITPTLQTGNPISHTFPVTTTSMTYTVRMTVANACPSYQVVEKDVTVQVSEFNFYLPVVMRDS